MGRRHGIESAEHAVSMLDTTQIKPMYKHHRSDDAADIITRSPRMAPKLRPDSAPTNGRAWTESSAWRRRLLAQHAAQQHHAATAANRAFPPLPSTSLLPPDLRANSASDECSSEPTFRSTAHISVSGDEAPNESEARLAEDELADEEEEEADDSAPNPAVGELESSHHGAVPYDDLMPPPLPLPTAAEEEDRSLGSGWANLYGLMHRQDVIVESLAKDAERAPSKRRVHQRKVVAILRQQATLVQDIVGRVRALEVGLVG